MDKLTKAIEDTITKILNEHIQEIIKDSDASFVNTTKLLLNQLSSKMFKMDSELQFYINKIKLLETEVELLKLQIKLGGEYKTINSYAKIHNITIEKNDYTFINKKAITISKQRKIPINIFYDVKLGSINTYTTGVLNEVFIYHYENNLKQLVPTSLLE